MFVKLSEGPAAVNSKLGWLLSGPIDSHEANVVSHTRTVINGVLDNPMFNNKGDALIYSLREFWNVESL